MMTLRHELIRRRRRLRRERHARGVGRPTQLEHAERLVKMVCVDKVVAVVVVVVTATAAAAAAAAAASMSISTTPPTPSSEVSSSHSSGVRPSAVVAASAESNSMPFCALLSTAY